MQEAEVKTQSATFLKVNDKAEKPCNAAYLT
jgi:hypothetical protein